MFFQHDSPNMLKFIYHLLRINAPVNGSQTISFKVIVCFFKVSATKKASVS